jgi:hypothetical protein
MLTPLPSAIEFPRPTATHRPPPHTTSFTSVVIAEVFVVLDAAVNVSSHTRPFRLFEYMIVVALAPLPP